MKAGDAPFSDMLGIMNRPGSLQISMDFWQPTPEVHELMGLLFTRFVPCRTFCDWGNRQVTLIGWSPEFDVVDSADPVPRYIVNISRNATPARVWHELAFSKLPSIGRPAPGTLKASDLHGDKPA